MSSIMDSPLIQAIMPFTMLVGCTLISIPPFILHTITHPFQYILNLDPPSVRIKKMRDRLFFELWRMIAPILNKPLIEHKTPLMTKAYGTVLEIGAGTGGNIALYDRAKVTKLILVEPNLNMHPKLLAAANAKGFFEKDGSLLLLGCGSAPSDEVALAKGGVTQGSIDTIASIHVLCGIPEPSGAVELYRRLLKPGGLFIFFEHVRSNQAYTAQWQDWYTKYFWPHAFDGCCVNRPTGAWILGGPQLGNPNMFGTEIVESDMVKKRWSETHIDLMPNMKIHAALPTVFGWAVKV